MRCKFIYSEKGKQKMVFDNEAQLDDFIMEKLPLKSKYGDLVFSKKSNYFRSAAILEKESKKAEKLKAAYEEAIRQAEDTDSERKLKFKRPFIGVTLFLDGRRNSQDELYYPEFIDENFWKDRLNKWTSLPNGNNDTLEQHFSDSELKLLVEGETHEELMQNYVQKYLNPDGSVRMLNPNEATQLLKLLLRKWYLMNTTGTAIHYVLLQYFSKTKVVKNGTEVEVNVRDLTNTAIHDENNDVPSIQEYIKNQIAKELPPLMGRRYREDLISDLLLEQLLNYGEGLYSHIKEVIGDSDLEFYPEFKITGKINQVGNGPDTLMGIIDLLVVDSRGHYHIFDYKTSDKAYGDYSEAKKRAFYYQLAVYARLIRKAGIAMTKSHIRILPIQLKDFKVVDRDAALVNPENAEFVFGKEGSLIDYPPSYSVNIKPEIFRMGASGNIRIMDNIDEFLPETVIKDATTEGLNDFVTNMMSQWFPEYSYKKERTDEEIEEEIKEGGGYDPDENGRYHFKLPGSYSRTIDADSPELMLTLVKKSYEKAANNREFMAKTVGAALEYGISHNTHDIDHILKSIDTKYIEDKTAFQDWFKNYVLKYCNNDWEIVDNDAIKHYGIILIRNKNTNQLDVLKTTSSFLKYNRHFGGKSRNLLAGAFETDLEEKANNKSLMLEAVNGNIEMIETMLVLNQLPTLFSGEYAGAIVGNILVVNPFRGTGLSATNEELLYCYNKLKQFKNISGQDNIESGLVKFGTKWNIARNDFINAMQEADDDLHNVYRLPEDRKTLFQSAKSELDRTVDPSLDTKIRIVTDIISNLELVYGFKQISTNQLKLESDLAPAYRLYFEMLQTLASLKGIDFRQQLKQSDKITEEKTFSGIVQKGLTGIYIDNPGNLSSETLNTITKLVTLAYLNIRQEMQEPTAKLRRLLEKLKKEKNFGYFNSAISNETGLYKNMTYVNEEGDLLFTNLNNLQGVEKEYLQYVMRLINRNRQPRATEEDLDEQEKSGDINYYRVPLAKAELQSRTYYKGMFKGLAERLKHLSPKNALADLRARASGFFEEGKDPYERSENLFQMNTMFDRGEPQASSLNSSKQRLDYIKNNGAAFFERNLEILALKHTFAYSTKRNIDEVMPTIKSAMAFLVMEGNTQNIDFNNDIEYLENYIKAKIKNQPIDDPILGGSEAAKGWIATTGKIRNIASILALAFSPVLGLYQTLQGFWLDISLIIRKPDGTNAFTWKNMLSAGKEVYADLFHYSDKPTKCQLINELYGINDMDMNLYAERMKNDKHGLWNLGDIAMKFTSRPDYYNRMTIIIALMKELGVWDALEVVDGKLEYNPKKDKRFNIYYNKDKSNPKYAELEALYYGMAQQAVREGMRNKDGSLFKIGLELPVPYTNQEMEGMKSLCDLIYGYYSHEKKSMVHATFVGAMYMQMRTYWSGKKNQYIAPGGVKLMGHWEPVKNELGQIYYYRTNPDGTVNYEEPPVLEDQLNDGELKIPFVQWKGQWQEGIILTLSNIFKNSSGINLISGYRNMIDLASPEMLKVYLANVKLFFVDLGALMFIGMFIGGLLMGDWDKEVLKDAKELGTFEAAIMASIVHILTQSVVNSASDFNWVTSIGGPMVSWSPFSFEFAGRLGKTWWNVLMGDPTFVDGIRNTFSAGRQMKPFMYWLNEQYKEDE